MAAGVAGELELAVAEVEATVQHRAIEHRQDVMQRPHPAEAVAAPAHRLRPGQLADRFQDDARQHVAGLAALLLDDREPELALAGVALLALVEAETDRAEEPRSEARRGGTECVSTGRSRWAPAH